MQKLFPWVILVAPFLLFAACGDDDLGDSTSGPDTRAALDGDSCQAPKVWRYQQPGCDADAHPVCGDTMQDACLQYACGCDGEILDGCDYYRKPWRSQGICPDYCVSPQTFYAIVNLGWIPTSKGCACDPATDAPTCMQTRYRSVFLSCVGGTWTFDQSSTCTPLDAATGAGGVPGTGGSALGTGGSIPGSGGISGSGGILGSGGSSLGSGGSSGLGGTASGGQTGIDASMLDSTSSPDNPLDAPPPDAPIDGGAALDGDSCPAPKVWRYQQPGCGADTHPVCGSAMEDACLRYACGCDGEILDGCDYYRKPWRSRGICPDYCVSPQTFDAIVNLGYVPGELLRKGCACNPASDVPECMQMQYRSVLLSCVGGTWTVDQSKDCAQLDAASVGG